MSEMNERKFRVKQKKAPLKSDRLLYYLFKSFLGAIFLYIILYSILPTLRDDPNYNFLSEVVVIIPIIIIADILGYMTGRYITNKFLKKWDYDTLDSKGFDVTNYVRYTIYLIIRICWFAFGLFWLLYGSLIDAGVMFAFAFLLSCLIMNITTKLLTYAIMLIKFM